MGITSRKPRPHTRQRHSQLLNLIHNGTTAVSELAAALAISESTVRRDLERLQAGNKIARTYGGALAAQTFRENSIGESALRAAHAKNAIAETAFAQLPRDGTIFLDAGTTCAALARRIAAHPDYPLTIVTRGLETILALVDAPHIRLILLGGTLRRMSHGMTGALSLLALERLHFAQCYLGADAVCVERGIGEPTLEETVIKKTVAARSGAVYVLADSGKLTVPPPPAWTRLTPGWTLITDTAARPLPEKNARCTVRYAESA